MNGGGLIRHGLSNPMDMHSKPGICFRGRFAILRIHEREKKLWTIRIIKTDRKRLLKRILVLFLFSTAVLFGGSWGLPGGQALPPRRHGDRTLHAQPGDVHLRR